MLIYKNKIPVIAILLCAFSFTPASASEKETGGVAASPQGKTPSVHTIEQATVLEEASFNDILQSQDTKSENGQTSSEEEQYLQNLDELTTESTDSSEGEEDGTITYDVPVVVNERVEFFVQYFQTKGRKYFEKWLARSERYLPMIRDILRQNSLPEDLAYLALIESGFNPHAKSRAKAVGMWQFMKWTGKKYGLRVDMWIDERKDPEKATRAAASYLKDLYGMFNSWHLAAASYNAGEGRVLRAVKRHNTYDFWLVARQKKALKKETRDYIPKYIAALLIAKDPEKYDFTDIEYEQGITYTKVNISGATDLRIIAEACECSVEEIKALNPELLKWFTPPNYPEYEIKLPEEKAEVFLANFAAIPYQERLNFLVHKVKKGETLSHIARRYGTSVNSIMYLNKLKSARYIRTGAELIVPVRAKKIATPETTSSIQRG